MKQIRNPNAASAKLRNAEASVRACLEASRRADEGVRAPILAGPWVLSGRIDISPRAGLVRTSDFGLRTSDLAATPAPTALN